MAIKTFFKGTLGKKPELRGEGDKAYLNFSLATDDFVGEGKGDQRQDGSTSSYKTTWINCIAFGRTAKQIADRFNPGDIVVVESGVLQVENYEKKDRESGKVIDANALSVKVKALEISGPYRRGSAEGGNGGGQQQARTSTGGNSGGGSRSNYGGQQQQQQQSRSQGAPAQSSHIDDSDIPF